MKASTQHRNAALLFGLITGLALYLLDHSDERDPVAAFLGLACFLVMTAAGAKCGESIARFVQLREVGK